MNTPTPRTALKATGMRRRHARCLETELAALTAERDQLRAEVKSCGELSCDECNARTAALTAERDQLRAVFPQICAAIGNGAFCTPTVSVGFIESIPNEIQLVVAELRARAERAEDNLAALEQCHDDNCRGLVRIADELATAKERLRSEAMDDYAAIKDLQRELAIERARLDWVFQNCKVEANDYTTGNRDVYYVHDREDLGAAMKEDAK